MLCFRMKFSSWSENKTFAQSTEANFSLEGILGVGQAQPLVKVSLV